MGSSSLLLPETGLEIVRGSTKTLEITVADLDDKGFDLTGCRILMSVKKDLNDPAPVIQKDSNVAAQSVITVPKIGIAEIYLKPTDTQNLDSTVDYVFDVWVITPGADRFAVVPPSVFRVKDTVTRIPL